MGAVVNKPDSYLLDIDAAKGFSLTDFSTWGLSDLSHPEGKKMGVVEAYTDVGWTRRCVNVRAKALASLPFGLYRQGSDEALWSESSEKPPELDWLRLRDFLFRAEVALSLVARAYALKEGTITQEGNIRRITDLRWWNPTTVQPHWRGPKDERGEFTQFERKVNSATEYWDRRVVLHVFQPDPFAEQAAMSSDGDAARINGQILSDMAQYSSDQLRSGLVKKTVAVAKEGRPPSKEERSRLESWLDRYLFGRGREQAKPRVVSGNIDFQVVGASLDELAENAISTEQREAIATAFGVPHSLVLSNAANFATAQADQINFYTTTVLFQSKVIEEALNKQLFEQLGLAFRFEPERLEVMQRMESEKAQAIVPLVQAGVYSVEYAQEVLGVPDEWRTTATPAPAFESQEEQDEAVMAEMRNWRKKAEKRGRTVKFSPDVIPDTTAGVIRERLAAGMELDEAFSPPFM